MRTCRIPVAGLRRGLEGVACDGRETCACRSYDTIVEFPCTIYGCRTFLDYALNSDGDWELLE